MYMHAHRLSIHVCILKRRHFSTSNSGYLNMCQFAVSNRVQHFWSPTSWLLTANLSQSTQSSLIKEASLKGFHSAIPEAMLDTWQPNCIQKPCTLSTPVVSNMIVTTECILLMLAHGYCGDSRNRSPDRFWNKGERLISQSFDSEATAWALSHCGIVWTEVVQ